VQGAFSQMTEMIRESLAGIAVIRAYTREQDTARRFTRVSTEYVRKNLALVKIWGSLFPFIVFISNISVCVLIFFGGRATIACTISAGDFVAFASYIWILIWPMMALGWIVNLFQRGAASMARINDVLAVPAEAVGAGVPQSPAACSPGICISALSFSYAPGAQPVLRDITLAIAPGETIGITGTTGSGKSTLCSLLLRFFDPPRGAVFIDGRDMCDIPLDELRASVAYVPQDSFLFSDTILENIIFGRPDASESDAARQAGLAQMTGEIESFSSGLATVIGEKGITLSGGQKQRLCIARALLMQAPVLILDDALSSLDAATAKSLIEQLKAQDRVQTRILVSNRIASIQHADMIYVIDKGRIEARGTHAELLARRGLYYQLYQRQRLEEAGAVNHE
jgi:ATP-binding cassette, subfamily B, multidrug efflux pump